MEIVVTGRRTQVSDRFRRHIESKLAKVTQVAPRMQRIEVMLSHEPNRRQAKACERIEITCRMKGPVIRAEACEDDQYVALDVALDKLMERLRRAADRRLVRRRRSAPAPVQPSALFEVSGADEAVEEEPEGPFDDSPIEVRQKVHRSAPMNLEQALLEMELVGHDFYLFHDVDTDQPSVVYRRRGWSYGVIHLETTASDDDATRDRITAFG